MQTRNTHLGWATGLLVILSACGGNGLAPGSSVASGGSAGVGNPNPDTTPVSDTDPNGTVTSLIHMNGAIQKGPFVVGSTTQVANLDVSGNPTGAVFSTATQDDLGEFALDFRATDLMSIESTGYYYNEATGSLSVSPLTLRALYHVSNGPDQSAYVNVVTHLTFGREKALIVQGATFEAARTQAEAELQTALGIVPQSFSAGVDGVAMNLLGGDSDGNAYLLAASAALATAAQSTDSNSPDAALQELLNQISLDLAETGTIEASRRARVAAALSSMDTAKITTAFATRLTALGASTTTIPNIDRILDQDGDGVLNSVDNCSQVSNPSQADEDSDGIGDACDSDRDGDGTPNASDSLPDDPREWTDSDGVPDNIDNCLGLDNSDQKDTDHDGTGDACQEETDDSWCMASEQGIAQCSTSDDTTSVLLICTNTVWLPATTCEACNGCHPGSSWQINGDNRVWICDSDGHIRRWDSPTPDPPQAPVDISSLPLDLNPPCSIQETILFRRRFG